MDFLTLLIFYRGSLFFQKRLLLTMERRKGAHNHLWRRPAAPFIYSVINRRPSPSFPLSEDLNAFHVAYILKLLPLALSLHLLFLQLCSCTRLFPAHRFSLRGVRSTLYSLCSCGLDSSLRKMGLGLVCMQLLFKIKRGLSYII